MVNNSCSLRINMGEAYEPQSHVLDVLVTAFGAFPGVDRNPTQEIVEHLFHSTEWKTPGAKIGWLRVY